MRARFLRWGVPLLLLAVFVLFVIRINQGERIALVNREGQTFEKGVVTQILQDNLQPDGSRVGEQRVVVRMTTGVRAGQELETTSSSGFLFGAGCTVGMHVVVMQSVAGESTITSIYSQDREWVIYGFAAAYLLVLCLVGGKQGVKSALGLVFTFFCTLFVYLPLVYQGWSPFWVAVFVCVVTTLVTMYLIGGPTKKTLVATGGTVAGVIIAGIAATVHRVGGAGHRGPGRPALHLVPPGGKPVRTPEHRRNYGGRGGGRGPLSCRAQRFYRKPIPCYTNST